MPSLTNSNTAIKCTTTPTTPCSRWNNETNEQRFLILNCRKIWLMRSRTEMASLTTSCFWVCLTRDKIANHACVKSATCTSGRRVCVAISKGKYTHAKSRPARGNSSNWYAACFICSYTNNRCTNCARGSISSLSSTRSGCGNSNLDLISINTAAMSKYSAAKSKFWISTWLI